MVRLDRLGDAVGPARLDHVGVERPLDEEADVAELARLVLEDADELLADPILRFSSGSLTPVEPREEALLRLRRGRAGRGSGRRTSRPPARPRSAQEPVVDEDAGELVADGLVDEQRGDRGVDAAGEPADHALAPDLRADPLDLLLDHGGGRPRGRRAGDVVEEVLQHLLAVRRVHDLGVELDAVEPRARVLERGDRRRGGRAGDDARALGRRDDRVAVAHPDGLLGGQAARRARRSPSSSSVLPNSPAPVRSTSPPSSSAISCIAVTDAERRHAELEERRVDRAARRRRTPTPGRRRGSARPGCAAAPPRRSRVCETSSE